jgi:hypothetical protein
MLLIFCLQFLFFSCISFIRKYGGKLNNKYKQYGKLENKQKAEAVRMYRDAETAWGLSPNQPPLRTIQNWEKEEREGKNERKRRSDALLTPNQRNRVTRWVAAQRDKSLSVSYEDIRKYVLTFIPLEPNQFSASYCSKLMGEAGLKTRKATPKDAHKLSAEYAQDRNKFRTNLAAVRSLYCFLTKLLISFFGLDRYPRLYCMDQVAIYKVGIPRQTHDYKGVRSATVKKKYRAGENARDTLIGCVGDKGDLVPAFVIEHCPVNKTRGIKKVSGMNKHALAYWVVKKLVPYLRGNNVTHMLFKSSKYQGDQWCEENLYAKANKRPLPEPVGLLVDQLSAHKRTLFRKYLKQVFLPLFSLDWSFKV